MEMLYYLCLNRNDMTYILKIYDQLLFIVQQLMLQNSYITPQQN